jgi:hypothetical protein
MYIPYMKGVSEKFKHVGNQYNIRTIFKTKHTLRKTRSDREPQQMAWCIYSIPSECGRSYIGERGRPLAVWLHEHNLKEGFLEKSKLAQHAYEEGHRIGWDNARILEIESNSRYRKYKESAHMACLTIGSANTVCTIIPYGSPSSVLRLPTHREDLYDVTYSSWVSIRF